ncbi:CHASE domain-containing protein [Ramlibacter rhizophilus]|uniref:histidine kinase n=1 Tax=Ramlibacter rhizophilus TaxID=1781167 RepID=A0A4Z0BRZ6_9BURK|nr:CHASE domain-containing protein [Ramlibacter rhizophilus]TFZ01200.1 hypothetical protein EZ242_07385 [Ramlibacter rhizophilus]
MSRAALWQRVRAAGASRAALVLAACLLLTALATLLAVQVVRERADAVAQAAVDQEIAGLDRRVAAYLALLRATRAFVEAQGEALNADEFKRFVAGLRIPSDYPGIQGIGWSPRLAPGTERYTILFLEPLDERNRAALGFDMHSEPVRAAAMDRARDLGEAAMSGVVLLKQEILPDLSPGFLIYEPVYAGRDVPESVSQRRARLRGFVYAPFRGTDFFNGLFRSPEVELLAIHTATAESDRPGGFLRGDPAVPLPEAAIRRRVNVAGQPWVLVFERSVGPPLAERVMVLAVFVLGVLVSGLLAALTRHQTRARHRAEKRSSEMRQRLQFSELLVGIVSHDLRNPLNVIQLNTALLSQAELPENFARCVRRIQASGEQSLRMIRDLLDFTQARLAGGIPVVRAPGDVAGIVQQAVDQVRVAHPGREVAFSAQGSGTGTWDADRIAQVVSNLVSNAIVYGDANAPIRVAVDGTGQRVRLSVHNLGEPIRPELMGTLFEPLRQGSSVGARGRNIGLGLYIVQQIARAHGGRVHCSSSREAGTLFTVELPRTS